MGEYGDVVVEEASAAVAGGALPTDKRVRADEAAKAWEKSSRRLILIVLTLAVLLEQVSSSVSSSEDDEDEELLLSNILILAGMVKIPARETRWALEVKADTPR
mmetsp:Transcript_11609/g.33056  ORF Transcript_11609/g.33056 Transcript_11609/m.33056 type:complete len:104 (-) Transcript_11609:233-544(-)